MTEERAACATGQRTVRSFGLSVHHTYAKSATMSKATLTAPVRTCDVGAITNEGAMIGWSITPQFPGVRTHASMQVFSDRGVSMFTG